MEKLCGEYARNNFEDEGAVGPGPFFFGDNEGDDENKEKFSEFD